jgi:hypothetical protein
VPLPILELTFLSHEKGDISFSATVGSACSAIKACFAVPRYRGRLTIPRVAGSAGTGMGESTQASRGVSGSVRPEESTFAVFRGLRVA